MAAVLKLGEADRVRLGAPEQIVLDVFAISNREAIALQRLGYRSPRAWRQALEPVRVEEPNEDGVPVLVDTFVDVLAWTGLIWIALRRCGVESDVNTLEFDIDALSITRDEPEDDAEGETGKDAATPDAPATT